MSDVVVQGGKRVYWGGGFAKEEVDAFIEEEEAAEEGAIESSSLWDPGSSGLPISPWAAVLDPLDSSVIIADGGKIAYWGGGFAKEEVDAFIEEKKAAGEEVIASPEYDCLSNIDCHPDFVCVFPKGAEAGTCIPRGDVGVQIGGVIDSKTCAFCLGMIGMTGALDSVPLPPYHKYCRCFFEYLESGEV